MDTILQAVQVAFLISLSYWPLAVILALAGVILSRQAYHQADKDNNEIPSKRRVSTKRRRNLFSRKTR